MTGAERRVSRPETMRGAEYRALRRLADSEDRTLADVGQTCARVPAAVLPLLLASGKIERETERRASAAPTKRRREDR